MNQESSCKMIMISAMYENGGNTTHRFLDGHPELWVYPFESQLGDNLVNDNLSSLFPFKYRWPEFPMAGNTADDYELFFDEELKTRLRAPKSSKFRDADLVINEKERKEIFVNLLKNKPRTRANIVETFFRATFESWTNYTRSGKEHIYVGYSPIIGVDTEKILSDFPQAHVLHVVRNPFSAYWETKQRPFPLSLNKYVWNWNFVQYMACVFREKYPSNFHILRYEDLVENPEASFVSLCKNLEISFSDSLLYPSWNGKKLDTVYPWGTIRIPTTETNWEAISKLGEIERKEILSISSIMLKVLRYTNLPFVKMI